MRSLKLRILLTVSLVLLAVFITPTEALAVPIQSLNGQTGQTQTFQNDTNVVINSSNNVHSLNWQGLLPVSRGGTGTGSFTDGSLLFFNGTSISEDNSNLFWDDRLKWLFVGQRIRLQPPALPYQVSSALIEVGTPEGSFNGIGAFLAMVAGHGEGTGHGGDLTLAAGSNLESGNGGDAFLGGGNGGGSGGNGGNVLIRGGISNFGSGNGGDILLTTGRGGGANGRIILTGSGGRAILNANSIPSSDKIFTFPNLSGTFPLLEANQTFTGLNKFEAATSSTIYVGSSTKTGCIVMGDSDGSGVTYVTANDGVLSASTTKPSFCQ